MQNAEKAIPELYVTLKGERKSIVCGLGTLARFQMRTGKNSFDLSIWADPNPVDVVTIVWAALGGEKTGKTPDEIGDEMDMSQLHEVGKLIGELIRRMSAPEDPAKKNGALGTEAAAPAA